MTSKTFADGILRALLITTLIVFGVYFLYEIQSVLVYVIIALILTLIGNPIQSFFKTKLKFKNTLSVVATISVFLLIIFGFIMMIIPLIISQGENLSLLNTASIETKISHLITELTDYLSLNHIDYQSILDKSDFASKINLKFIPNFLNILINFIGNFGMGLFSVLFITFFFLKDKFMFIRNIRRLMPDKQEDKILNSLTKINQILTKYFIGLLLQLTVVFILYYIVLLIFGIENAFVIAFLCAILNIIPYIGPMIGSVFAFILTMLNNINADFQTETLPTAIYVLIGFCLVQFIDNNFSQPMIFSKSMDSHPLEIFIISLIAGFTFGIIGMIVAIPLFQIIKVVAKEFYPNNKFVQVLTKNV